MNMCMCRIKREKLCVWEQGGGTIGAHQFFGLPSVGCRLNQMIITFLHST
ncbi:hypothetical protein HanXRQr2_Chr10g0433031 [Helianthus annuus]|uniref:Uncharacterized protein n=1 Tax=Helianthus annuus TaxID=4232 RepID=A0A9K3HWX5_HELAN|nr:hypothetical protein HanXRQr2_Chr10g0433031 [Helianthus annuus]